MYLIRCSLKFKLKLQQMDNKLNVVFNTYTKNSASHRWIRA